MEGVRTCCLSLILVVLAALCLRFRALWLHERRMRIKLQRLLKTVYLNTLVSSRAKLLFLRGKIKRTLKEVPGEQRPREKR